MGDVYFLWRFLCVYGLFVISDDLGRRLQSHSIFDCGLIFYSFMCTFLYQLYSNSEWGALQPYTFNLVFAWIVAASIDHFVYHLRYNVCVSFCLFTFVIATTRSTQRRYLMTQPNNSPEPTPINTASPHSRLTEWAARLSFGR
jgi:hypothetical protein